MKYIYTLEYYSTAKIKIKNKRHHEICTQTDRARKKNFHPENKEMEN
jgi:hypothetical protein